MTDIYHAGIKGQKKGVRRYQYKNGTYTREGNLRYRPPKGDQNHKIAKRIIAGSLMGEMALIMSKSAQNGELASVLSQTFSTLNANKVSAGKAIVDAVLKVPTPVRAMALPIAAVGVGVGVASVIMNGEQIVEKLKDIPWAKISAKAISYGASAAGVALSTTSGNPMPAVMGIMTSALLTALEKDY